MSPHVRYDYWWSRASRPRTAGTGEPSTRRRSPSPGCAPRSTAAVAAAAVSWTDQPMAEMDEVVYALVRHHGGTVSAEHGIGTKKKPYLPYSRSAPELRC